jgi:hypothetical protein
LHSDKHLRVSLANIGFLCLGLIAINAVSIVAAPRKSGSGRSAPADRAAARPAPETVYVASPSPKEDAPASLFGSSSSSSSAAVHDADERRTRAAFATGPLRDYEMSVGLNAGFYSAEVLGSNPFANVFWDLYPGDQPYFFEFTLGGGSVQSDFSRSVVGGGVFPNSFMIAGEALGGYAMSGIAKGMGRAGGLFPYFLGGITAIYQGGVPNIGGVLGFGNRMNIPFGPKDGRWALNYSMRDHIYSQKIRTTPSLTQNFVLLIGVQKYL